MGNAANNRAEHESGDEGEEHKVDEALESVVAQTRHGLDVVLQREGGTDLMMACINRSESTCKDLKALW